MESLERGPAVLLGATGLRIPGGIASVSRCMARSLDDAIADGSVLRADRVLLLDDTAPPPPASGSQRLAHGSQARFVLHLWWSVVRGHPDLVIFDLLGLARATALPLPGFPPRRFAVFAHGQEIDRASPRHLEALHRAASIMANSEFTAERIAARFPELADRTRVVPLCIDPGREAAWSEVRDEPAPERRPAALIVGRMWSEERGKGHDELIAAWPGIAEQVPDAELWVVGDGDDVDRLRAAAAGTGCGKAIHFLGAVSDEELARLYRTASLLAMPSRQEGFGLVYVEAMSFGLPCVGSTADAAAWVIEDGETGALVPYADVPALTAAVASLLKDPARLRALGGRAQERARERFSYETFRAALLAAVREAALAS